jgi:hypothetical protein
VCIEQGEKGATRSWAHKASEEASKHSKASKQARVKGRRVQGSRQRVRKSKAKGA